ncbi:MAG: aminotransferase class I/II-fold pyridoxal phosphate-dependent enzyme [Bacteroidales bacterium]
MLSKINLSLAHMSGYEQRFIQEAFDTHWVAPLGPNVEGFERDLEDFLGLEQGRVVALSSGTAAIHLALLQLGVTPGDEVICQSFTFAASANPIRYLGASPVFVDSRPDHWNMDPELLEVALADRIRVTGRRPKAVIPVHLYGMPAPMDAIMRVAGKYGVPVLEDAAEALGSAYKGRPCGTFGQFACLSFNGNKMVTTSGGGALVSGSAEAAGRTLFFATQARDEAPHYQHSEIGYNYRLSNICAGIGRGQMLGLEGFVARRREINKLYKHSLEGNIPGISFLTNPSADYESNHWLTCILVDPAVAGFTREDVRLALEAENIESRPLWKPMHLQPVFAEAPFYSFEQDPHGQDTDGQDTHSAVQSSSPSHSSDWDNSVCGRLFRDGLCLPSGAGLSNADVERVVGVIRSLV